MIYRSTHEYVVLPDLHCVISFTGLFLEFVCLSFFFHVYVLIYSAGIEMSAMKTQGWGDSFIEI